MVEQVSNTVPKFLRLSMVGGDTVFVRADQILSVRRIPIRSYVLGEPPTYYTEVVTPSRGYSVMDDSDDVMEALRG